MKSLRPACAFLLPMLLCSCFTMGLWGFDPEDEPDPWTGKDETTFAYDPETKWSWESFGLRVLLTPLTLCLDCVTAPVQVFLFGDEDDDASAGCSERRRHR